MKNQVEVRTGKAVYDLHEALKVLVVDAYSLWSGATLLGKF
jgi:hypothetical protein